MVLDITPRPIMLVAGENAHSLYNSQDVYEAASNPKELLIVPDAEHVDLHDNPEKIPFDKLEAFSKLTCNPSTASAGDIWLQPATSCIRERNFLFNTLISL